MARLQEVGFNIAHAQWGFFALALLELLNSFPIKILNILIYQEYLDHIAIKNMLLVRYILNLCDLIERLGLMYILIILKFSLSLG